MRYIRYIHKNSDLRLKYKFFDSYKKEEERGAQTKIYIAVELHSHYCINARLKVLICTGSVSAGRYSSTSLNFHSLPLFHLNPHSILCKLHYYPLNNRTFLKNDMKRTQKCVLAASVTRTVVYFLSHKLFYLVLSVSCKKFRLL